jgi:ABC-type sugar transport system ATPase subunit
MEVRSGEAAPILEVEGIVKRFPGVTALDGVGLRLGRGEVHALVGENGAGKSTLIHILGGILRPDAGRIFLAGREVRFASPRQAADLGISIVFQELTLAPNLSVAENVFFNSQPTGRLGIVDRRRLDERTEELLRSFRLPLHPRTPAKRLSVAMQQMVEVLKALARDPEVLILDEPTAALGAAEAEILFERIGKLRGAGKAVLYVSHHLPEIFRLADRVTVLRDGRNVATRDIGEVDEARLAGLMVGREVRDIYGARSSAIGDEVLRVEGLSSGKKVRDVSFSLRAGEILGLAGLVGAGRTELGRAIFGAGPVDGGRKFVRGEEVWIGSPAEAIRRRIAYMTEDRKEQGLFLKMTLRENCVAASLDCFQDALGLLREKEISRHADISRVLFDIATPSIRQQVRNLSGGNQQKVLLAMWIGTQPLALIVDEPTRGVDIGARAEIYALLRESAAKGIGILLISSDLTEVLGMSDRILVMREGRIAGEFLREEATEERIIASAAGVTPGLAAG